jgi:hypothetical protein
MPEFDALTWGAEHALKAVVLARRAHSNLEFFRHLRHCKEWHDVADLQESWLKEAFADYGEEVGRFAGTSLQLATSQLMPCTSSSSACSDAA